MRYSMTFACLLACAMLAGCGNPEPSSKDIQAAVQRFMMGPNSKIIDATTITLDKDGLYEQKLTAEKIACKISDDAPGAACDFTVASCYAKSGESCAMNSFTHSARFVKGDKGWTYVPASRAAALSRPADEIEAIIYTEMMRGGGAAGAM